MDSKRVKKTLDRLAYASLILDICIAVITSLSIFGVNEQHFLVPVNYLLTLVVVLSVVMFAVLFLLRAKERQV